MKYIDFLNHFQDFSLITYSDIRNAFSEVNHVQLINWQKKNLLIKLKRGMFALPNKKIDPKILANRINPSYISLEYALAFYQIIPETAFVITSVSKQRNEKISNTFGNFYYQKIKPELWTGFTVIKNSGASQAFRIASPEKALFDLVYFRPDLKNDTDFASLRLNIDKNFRTKIISEYSTLVKAGPIKERLLSLQKFLYQYSVE